jgi:hypothetical protein
MSDLIRTIGVFLTLCVVAGCSPRLFHRDAACSPAPTYAVAFDSAQAPALAGDYDLMLVSEWEHEAGRSVRGRLHLEPTDSVHRSFEQGFGRQRRVDVRPLWGWATLSSKTLSVPWSADPASQNPEHPGVLLHSNGQLEFGVWRGLDGSSTNLAVQFVTPAGFAGHWGSDLGIVQIVENGRVLGNPHGYFCAFRR